MVPVTAGCLDEENGDRESDSEQGEDDSDESEGTEDAEETEDAETNMNDIEDPDGLDANGEPFEHPADWPDDPTFTPNPDADGPGGDVTIAMTFSLNEDYGEVGNFETFEVVFDSITLHGDEADDVTVPVDRTVDFYDFDIGADIVLVFDADIPTGVYERVSFDMAGSEIIHDHEGAITDQFQQPEAARIGVDGLDAQAGSQWVLLASQMSVTDTPSLRFPLEVGYFEGVDDMTDPDFFVD